MPCHWVLWLWQRLLVSCTLECRVLLSSSRNICGLWDLSGGVCGFSVRGVCWKILTACAWPCFTLCMKSESPLCFWNPAYFVWIVKIQVLNLNNSAHVIFGLHCRFIMSGVFFFPPEWFDSGWGFGFWVAFKSSPCSCVFPMYSSLLPHCKNICLKWWLFIAYWCLCVKCSGPEFVQDKLYFSRHVRALNSSG